MWYLFHYDRTFLGHSGLLRIAVPQTSLYKGVQCQLSDGAYLARWALTGRSLPRESGEWGWKSGPTRLPVRRRGHSLRTILPSDEISYVSLKRQIFNALSATTSEMEGKKRDPAFLCEGPWGPCRESSMEEWCITFFFSAVFSFLHLMSVCTSIFIYPD